MKKLETRGGDRPMHPAKPDGLISLPMIIGLAESPHGTESSICGKQPHVKGIRRRQNMLSRCGAALDVFLFAERPDGNRSSVFLRQISYYPCHFTDRSEPRWRRRAARRQKKYIDVSNSCG